MLIAVFLRLRAVAGTVKAKELSTGKMDEGQQWPQRESWGVLLVSLGLPGSKVKDRQLSRPELIQD